MTTLLIPPTSDWTLVAANSQCTLQLDGVDPATIHVYVGLITPIASSQYFELHQGQTFAKTITVDSIYVRNNPTATQSCLLNITLGEVGAIGGSGSGGAVDSVLRELVGDTFTDYVTIFNQGLAS